MKINGGIYRPVYLFLFVSILFPALAIQQDASIRMKNLWKTYKVVGSDSTRIRILAKLSFLSVDMLNDNLLCDSIGDLAIKIADKSSDVLQQINARNNYLESIQLDFNFEKAHKIARQALLLSQTHGLQKEEWRCLHNMVSLYRINSNFDIAIILCGKEMELAKKIANKEYVVESYLDYGICLQGHSKMKEALDNFFDALRLSESLNNKTLLKKCYFGLSDFYSQIKTFDKALEYKRNQQVIILAYEHPLDSVELMWTMYQKHVIIERSNNLVNEKSIEQVINYAIKTGNFRLLEYEFAVYRKNLLDANEMDRLYKVYNIRYPDQLRQLSIHDLGTYYRLKAFFMEQKNDQDSAYYYFQKAEEKLSTNPNRFFRSNFYIRFGQFLMRTGRTKEAIARFSTAYNLAEPDRWFGKMEFMITASSNLYMLYAATGDYKNAYLYSEKCSWLRDSITLISSKEKVDRMQLDFQARLDNEKMDNQIRRRNIWFMVILVVIVIVSLFAVVVFIQRLRISKEKKRSDKLLLNILPSEVAEELKIYGKTKAKHFDEVTVMFTDFKDFTQVSETLSADELVDIIHSYFSEFDRIIEKYGIEKIKTIGDSYMCVGGLPVVNQTHALDVVNAAMELQELICKEKARRSSLGQTFFELRIGIHTGPVIAGIVGINKFAYDIWGDTVNTASRLETEGEINKVNISRSTHERVKDKFSCTYQGKKNVKHKGEIDMYFVDSSKE